MRRFAKIIPVVVVTALLASSTAPAYAESESKSPETIASYADAVSPKIGAIKGNQTQSGDIVFRDADTYAEVPADAGGTIKLEGLGDQVSEVLIGLPKNLDVQDGEVVSDGSMVYTSDNGDGAIVQVFDDAQVRIQTVVHDHFSAGRISYPLGERMEAFVRVDGSVDLVKYDGNLPLIVGFVDKPWAFDANGRELHTFYTSEAGSLVQHVEVSALTNYPVVADPTISLGWGVYIKYNKSETAKVAKQFQSSGVDFLPVLAAGIPNPYLAAFSAVAISKYLTSIGNTFQTAKNQGKCVQLRNVAGVIVGWNVVKC